MPGDECRKGICCRNTRARSVKEANGISGKRNARHERWHEAKKTFYPECQAIEDTSLNTSHVHVPFVFSALFKKCFAVKKNKTFLTMLK